MTTLSAPWNGYQSSIARATSQEQLDALRTEIFGRKAGAMTRVMRELASLESQERRQRGKEYNDVKTVLERALTDRSTELKRMALRSIGTDDALDIALAYPDDERGHLHPVHEFIRSTHDVFGRMGFDVAQGPELETEEINFNMLNIPADHPARDMQDTFWISSQERTVLRTHTSSVQIHYMLEHQKPPFRMICTGKVYRKDSDATHSPMFHQIEGLMIGESVSLANMKAIMEKALLELIAPNIAFRWRTGFFPFVEPGLEMDVQWQGDAKESREGKWLEIVGCGMVHPNVLRNVGIDPAKYQGFAFGFGVERMLMIKHHIPDLRLFYSGDLRFLRQF